MPACHILRSSQIKPSFRVEQVKGMFDVPHKDEVRQEWTVNLPVEEKSWLIGAIVGHSGSGKSTIASEIFKDSHLHDSFEWNGNSLLDNFPKELATKDIVAMLSSVGLSSPPHWLKPFGHLSNGQKFRVELARLILSGHQRVVFDEFTSVVDRDVAKICCAALCKTLRRKKAPQLVAISCHFDILDWLQPDWVFDVDANRFEWRSLRRRPDIELEIHEASPADWQTFKAHHYLDANLSRAAKCFVAFWNNRPVGFTSYMHFPHPDVPNYKREHRTVVLPDYQGVGIGSVLSEWLGEFVIEKGFRLTSCSSHPAVIMHRARSALWRCSRLPGHLSANGKSGIWGRGEGKHSTGRATCSFEFIGGIPAKVADKGVEN